MKKLIVCMLMALACAFLPNICEAEVLQQHPGRVALYNRTSKIVSFTIVGKKSSQIIEPEGKLVRKFNPDTPTALEFWYFDDPKRKLIGRISVFNGDVYVVTPRGIQTIIKVERPERSAKAPNFSNPEEVFADIFRMRKECAAKKAKRCVAKCNDAEKALTDVIRNNPKRNPRVFKLQWEEAYEEYKKVK
jgi:hypothetical protein